MYCQNCGTQLQDDSTLCHYCGQPPLRTYRVPPADIADDPAMRMLMPVGRSAWAIAAGYAGLFAVTLILAPLALLLGICAVVDLKRHPQKHGMGRAVFGLVMGLLGCLVPIAWILAIIVRES